MMNSVAKYFDRSGTQLHFVRTQIVTNDVLRHQMMAPSDEFQLNLLAFKARQHLHP